MALFHHFDWLHAVAGLLVGVLVGLTGVGGGSLMTPLLVLLFGVSPQTAVGTDLLFAAITKITGSAVHGWRDTVEWKIVRRLALGSVPAAVITLAALAQVGHIGKTMQRDLLLALAVLLALTSLTVLFRSWLIRFAADLDPLDPPGKAIAGTIALGAVIGVAVSMTSVGAGAIGVGAADAVSAPAYRAHRGVRHRPCGAAGTGGGHWPLVHRRCRWRAAHQPAWSARSPAWWQAARFPPARPIGCCGWCWPACWRSPGNCSSRPPGRSLPSSPWRLWPAPKRKDPKA
jgi:uncharacterized membrane protein YfcA